MFTTLKAALISTAVAAASTVAAAAAPAQAGTPECTSAITVYSQFNGMTVGARKGSHLGSTTCWMARYSSGPGVAALQRTLVECYDENSAVDGHFGPATQQALKNAQADTNRIAGRTVITVDGNYGPQTRYWFFFYGTGPGGFRQCEGPLGGWGGV